MMDTYDAPDAIKRLADRLRAAQGGLSLLERLRAANAGRPAHSTDHLFDPGLIERLTPTVWLDTSDDAVPIRPIRTRRPAGIARQAALPPMLPPRLIHRDAAAAYVGVSPNTFDKMIVDGLMPSPRRLSERRLAWDVRQLDAAIDLLPVDGEAANDATDDTSWNDIDAQAKAKSAAH